MPTFPAWCCSCQHRWCLCCECSHTAWWSTENTAIPGHWGWMRRSHWKMSTSVQATVFDVFTKEMASYLTKHVWIRGNEERLWNEKQQFFFGWVDMSYRSAQCDGIRDGTKADRWTKRKFLGFVFPGCKDCQAHGELFKLWAWKRVLLHLSHILLKLLLQMCLPIPAI